MAFPVWMPGGCRLPSCVSCRLGADLDEVVGEYPVSAPGPGPFEGGEFGPAPAVTAFEVVDPSFSSGSPFDLGAECSSVFELSAGRTWLAGPWDRDAANPEAVQFGFHRGVSVAAISGH